MVPTINIIPIMMDGGERERDSSLSPRAEERPKTFDGRRWKGLGSQTVAFNSNEERETKKARSNNCLIEEVGREARSKEES